MLQFHHIRLLIKRLGIVLLLFTICRVLFFAFNYNSFPGITTGDFFRALFYGIRFDISAIVYFNILYTGLHIIPHPFREQSWYQGVQKGVFYLFNGLALLLAVSDMAYYQFTLKRTTVAVFGIVGDFFALLPQYLLDFWYLLLILLLLLVLAEWLYRKTKVGGKQRVYYGWSAVITNRVLSNQGIREAVWKNCRRASSV